MTNRSGKLLLEDAWQHYWSVLFPGSSDWQNDLETEVRRRLYNPGEIDGFLCGKEERLQPPTWARDFELNFDGSKVSGRFRNVELGTARFF